MKFLITLLSSSNEKLLHLSYDTIINQYSHNLDYTIVIVVNSLNKNYINDVNREFKNIDVEIIETLSNGKPGKGHNSLFTIFKNKPSYDYLISIDGDDFLYPYALHQLSKCFNINKNVDVVCIYGNDTIRDYYSHFDISDIYLMNHFYLRMGYNLPKNFSESEKLFNPCRTNIVEKGVQTIIRFIMCSRNFIDLNNSNLYCEKCNILDDYKFYLNYLDIVLNKNINGMIINSDHIYLYNNINHNSVSKIHEDKFTEDYKIIKSYINNYKHLENNIGIEWNLDSLIYCNLSLVFDEKMELLSNNNGSYSINKNDLIEKINYKYIIDFATNLVQDYYDVCIESIEFYLFESKNNNDKVNVYNLCKFLVNNKISDRKLFVYMAICCFYNEETENTIKFIEKSEYMKYKYPILVEYYKNYKNNQIDYMFDLI